MKIGELECLDKLVFYYAGIVKCGTSAAQMFAHEAIYKYMYDHYEEFRKFFKNEKWECAYHPPVEWAQKHVNDEWIKKDKVRLTVYTFAIELDKVIQRLIEKPTPSERHRIDELMGVDIDW